MAKYTSEQISYLQDRWIDHEEELNILIPQIRSDRKWYDLDEYQALIEGLGPPPDGVLKVVKDLRGAPLRGADVSGADLSGTDLSGADLSGGANLSAAWLTRASLFAANLSGTNLSGARLYGTDFSAAVIWDTDLSGAILRGVTLSGVDLRGVDFSGATLVGTNLSGANLTGVDLSTADLEGADLSRATLWGADFSEANLWRANLSGARLESTARGAKERPVDLSGANLDEANLSGARFGKLSYTSDEFLHRLKKWWGPRMARHIPFLKRYEWRSIDITTFEKINTAEIDASGNPILKRYIEDYQFIRTFRDKSWVHRRVIYPLWKGMSDCGRSLLLWGIWSTVIALIFAIVYRWVFGCERIVFNVDKLGVAQPGFGDYLYYSVVTFTTLGFGDVVPLDGWARCAVGLEVVIGYVMLGGLISILASKLARRA